MRRVAKFYQRPADRRRRKPTRRHVRRTLKALLAQACFLDREGLWLVTHDRNMPQRPDAPHAAVPARKRGFLLAPRNLLAESIDESALDRAAHRQPLPALGRLSRISERARVLLDAIRR